MFALDRSSRAVFAGGAFAAFAGAFLTTPLIARGAVEPVPVRAPRAGLSPAPSAFAVVLPRRDPFAGSPPVIRRNAPPAAPPPDARAQVPAIPAAPPIPAAPAIPGALQPLPPNAGAANAPFPFAAPGARVTAVVTGARPFALVDETGTTRLITLGDRVAGDDVIAITADGVRLAGGRVLTVAPTASALRTAPRGR